jgi:outer membrane protein OmpA-like peptidoglycan-associated protein
LAFNVRGSADATQLHTLDTINNRDFIKWQRLQLNGLDYQHPRSLEIERIDLSQPYARFIINPDLSTNINDLLVERSESTAQEASEEQASEPLAIRIGGIAIADGSANFADFSLRPPFVTAIQSLNGDIGTLDNREQKPASVNIAGKVDQYAPVSIKGSLTPFDPLQSLDIATSFRQVELTTLTPYAGKFAGYRIRKGRLNLDLHYRIQNGQLNADNKVVLEQLQLGEQVDSPDAVDLPVRLAVALLKDSNGTISIELPVQGDLNNPQFSVMPIIWQTLRNLVVRAAKAPFKFIAGLAGGDQSDLSHIDFAPGSSELDPAARQTLDTLAAGLKQRPGLRLEIEGMSATATDGPLLAEERLQDEYRQIQYRILQRRGDKVPSDPAQLTVDEQDQAPLLEGIYRSRLKQQPPAEWDDLESETRAQQLRQAIIDSWAQSPALLRRLSRERAASIKSYLVQAGLTPERIYLLDTGTTEAGSDGRIATTLNLGSEE